MQRCPQVAVIAKLPAAPGKRDELVAGASRQPLDNVEGEAGTLMYILHADAKDADTAVVLRAVRRPGRARGAHGSRTAFKALGLRSWRRSSAAAPS